MHCECVNIVTNGKSPKSKLAELFISYNIKLVALSGYGAALILSVYLVLHPAILFSTV